MIIDSHNHLWMGAATGEGFLDNAMSVEAILQDMDAAGVDVAGVCSIAQDIQNDYILNAQRNHPDRLVGSVFVNPRSPDAADTLKKYLDLGLVGVKLHPRLHGFPLSSVGLVHPLMEICQQYGVSVFVHGASNEEMNSPFHFQEIAQAFPEVVLIYGHMAAFNDVDNAILVAKRNANVYLDTSLCSLANLRQALNILGAEKIIMGTDWPGNDFRMEIQKVELACDGDKEVLQKICCDNYRKLVPTL